MTKIFPQSLKDSSRFGLLLSIFFFAGIVTSAFVLFMLPHDLVFKGHIANIDGAWGVLIPLFLVVSVTFLLGISAVTIALLGKKETVVYLEKKKNGRTSQDSKTDTSIEESNLLKTFKSEVQSLKGAAVLEDSLAILCKQLDAGQGALYVTKEHDGKKVVQLQAGYALNKSESNKVQFEFGEGLVGQAAATGNSLYLDEVPEGYITILSGLGSASAKYLFMVVLKSGDVTKGVLELATFAPLKDNLRKQIEEASKVLADKIS